MQPQLAPLATSLLFASTVLAQAGTYNLTSTGCQDVDSYNTCTLAAASRVQTCEDAARAAQSEIALLACGCVYYIDMMNCYMASCWNKVYECEYQEYAIQYLTDCATTNVKATDIPFFPAPASGVPGSCSCNLGALYLAVNASEIEGETCVTNVGQAALANVDTDPITTSNKETACACCGASGAISAYYNICPDTDPSLIGIAEVYVSVAALGENWALCDPYMNAYNCTTELDFTDVADGTFYTPNNLPLNGTETLSNVPGTLSAPPSGTLFSYTNYYDSTVYTITAAVDGVSAAVASGTGGGSSVASGTVSSSSGGAAVPTATIQAGDAAPALGHGHERFGVAAVALAGAAIVLV